jgi:hypothetical protein
MNPTLTMILSVPVTLAIVNLMKRPPVNLEGGWSALVAVLVATALAAATFLLADSGLYLHIMQGLIVGLSAAGVYDTATASAQYDNGKLAAFDAAAVAAIAVSTPPAAK